LLPVFTAELFALSQRFIEMLRQAQEPDMLRRPQSVLLFDLLGLISTGEKRK
jgi:hypothetical protein